MAPREIARGVTEDEARAEAQQIAGAAFPKVETFVALLLKANEAQNLISRGSVSQLWSRHVLDSLQLARFARVGDRSWLDVGTGAGFPGLVLALLDRWDMTLVEPRGRRAEFLRMCIDQLGLRRVIVAPIEVERCVTPVDVVSARAVATIAEVLKKGARVVKASTRFILPKGERFAADVENARRDWHGVFHVEHSLTNEAARIIVIDEARAR